MPSTWSGIEPATLGIEGQRYTNSPTSAIFRKPRIIHIGNKMLSTVIYLNDKHYSTYRVLKLSDETNVRSKAALQHQLLRPLHFLRVFAVYIEYRSSYRMCLNCRDMTPPYLQATTFTISDVLFPLVPIP
ncbi:hypothetical protein ANN_23248 [Periplaneta americana]|uniref:Uncharacterized protein n=1 Tax=Periplaneta americana TaxID=6978 RepID=A0ABQ8SKK7_PERAM|nr:hypothetical protein ANN_23248 [Periplaneta americana]